jgi:hypothetical protein
MSSPSDAAATARVKVFESHLQKMPIPLRKGFVALREQESKIKALLATPAGQEAFWKDPVAAMEAGGVEIADAVRRVLRKNAALGQAFLSPERITLPTGQVLTPKVKVTFTT